MESSSRKLGKESVFKVPFVPDSPLMEMPLVCWVLPTSQRSKVSSSTQILSISSPSPALLGSGVVNVLWLLLTPIYCTVLHMLPTPTPHPFTLLLLINHSLWPLLKLHNLSMQCFLGELKKQNKTTHGYNVLHSLWMKKGKGTMLSIYKQDSLHQCVLTQNAEIWDNSPDFSNSS